MSDLSCLREMSTFIKFHYQVEITFNTTLKDRPIQISMEHKMY